MADQLYFPFNSLDTNGGKPDRVYDAEDFASYFKQFVGDGVFPNPSTNLQVLTQNNNMVLTIKSGAGFIKGHVYISKVDTYVTINNSHVSYNRLDAIVLQLNLTDRIMHIVYKEGIASANPSVPELLRNDDIWEIRLAQILVKSGVTKITAENITDTRTNGTVCGVVTNVVQNVDSTTLYNQYQTYLTNKMTEWNNTKLQQATDWNNQMNSQAVAFSTKQTEIQTWFNTVQSDQGHNHDARYYQKSEVDTKLATKIPTTASCNKNWAWSGQTGQPSWLWGSNDGANMYVYNPANFSVAYAANAGTLSGVTLAQIQEMIKKAGDIVGKKMFYINTTISASWNTPQVFTYTNNNGGMLVLEILPGDVAKGLVSITVDGVSIVNNVISSITNDTNLHISIPFNTSVAITTSANYSSLNIKGFAYINQ